MNRVSETLWGAYALLEGEVRLIFESLTGMQELWGDENTVVRFYAETCPKLFELETLSYWIVKGDRPSLQARSQMNQIAQKVIDLGLRRGKTYLNPLKSQEHRDPKSRRWHKYRIEGQNQVSFEEHRQSPGEIEVSPPFERGARDARTPPERAGQTRWGYGEHDFTD